jgi:hypothetical protein
MRDVGAFESIFSSYSWTTVVIGNKLQMAATEKSRSVKSGDFCGNFTGSRHLVACPFLCAPFLLRNVRIVSAIEAYRGRKFHTHLCFRLR